MANPDSYIKTRLKLHTAYNYIPFIPAERIQASITVPAEFGTGDRSNMRRTINLGSHGMDGVPFIYGFVNGWVVNGNFSSVIRPLCGTVPIRTATGNGDLIHWTLGVGSTSVFISEGRSYPFWTGNISLSVDIYISDKVI